MEGKRRGRRKITWFQNLVEWFYMNTTIVPSRNIMEPNRYNMAIMIVDLRFEMAHQEIEELYRPIPQP